MEQLKELKELNTMLQATLKAKSAKITEELIQILNGTAITMLPTYEKSDIASFNFEYRHEWFSIAFFGSNARGLTITEPISILFKELNEYHSKSENVMDEMDELEENLEGDTDEWEDMMDEYNEEKNEIYEDWFVDCWKKAQSQTQNTTPTYFSIEELDCGTELVSSDYVEINKNQSVIRYYTH